MLLGRQRSLSESQSAPTPPPHVLRSSKGPQASSTLDSLNINVYSGSSSGSSSSSKASSPRANSHHQNHHGANKTKACTAGERRASFAACAARTSSTPVTAKVPLSTGPYSPQVVAGRHRKYSLPGCLIPGENSGNHHGHPPAVHVERTQVVSQEIPEVPKDHYRVVFLGPPRVGKTAIVSQFLYDRFIVDYKATVEEMHRGEYDVAGCPLTLDILDTSGSNEFPAMRALSISNADAFVLVYAIDDASTFDDVRNLRDAILAAKQGRATPTVVVGNKCDLKERREVSSEAAETIVSIDWENGFVEASAKENINIVAIFKELLAQANIRYALSPAVRRRRQSLPSYSQTRNCREGRTAKRNSCALS